MVAGASENFRQGFRQWNLDLEEEERRARKDRLFEPKPDAASLRDRPTNWAHYFQLSRGFHHLQAEPG